MPGPAQISTSLSNAANSQWRHAVAQPPNYAALRDLIERTHNECVTAQAAMARITAGISSLPLRPPPLAPRNGMVAAILANMGPRLFAVYNLALQSKVLGLSYNLGQRFAIDIEPHSLASLVLAKLEQLKFSEDSFSQFAKVNAARPPEAMQGTLMEGVGVMEPLIRALEPLLFQARINRHTPSATAAPRLAALSQQGQNSSGLTEAIAITVFTVYVCATMINRICVGGAPAWTTPADIKRLAGYITETTESQLRPLLHQENRARLVAGDYLKQSIAHLTAAAGLYAPAGRPCGTETAWARRTRAGSVKPAPARRSCGTIAVAALMAA
jgi:hypothetical protein